MTHGSPGSAAGVRCLVQPPAFAGDGWGRREVTLLHETEMVVSVAGLFLNFFFFIFSELEMGGAGNTKTSWGRRSPPRPLPPCVCTPPSAPVQT